MSWQSFDSLVILRSKKKNHGNMLEKNKKNDTSIYFRLWKGCEILLVF